MYECCNTPTQLNYIHTTEHTQCITQLHMSPEGTHCPTGTGGDFILFKFLLCVIKLKIIRQLLQHIGKAALVTSAVCKRISNNQLVILIVILKEASRIVVLIVSGTISNASKAPSYFEVSVSQFGSRYFLLTRPHCHWPSFLQMRIYT